MPLGLLNLSSLISPARRARRIKVGWFLDTEKAKFIWPAPEPIIRQETGAAKSVLRCPAVRDLEARTYNVACPFDADLAYVRDTAKGPGLKNLNGVNSTIRPGALNALITFSPRAEWRHPDRPILQFTTPYTFVADDPVYLNQLPPLVSYNPDPLPGVLIGGRFPIHIWPRVLSWAFEWHDVNRPLVFRRDRPWFSLRFETQDPVQNIRLVEADFTPALRDYVQGLRGVTNYVNRTYGLFKTAAARRPKQLLVEKRR